MKFREMSVSEIQSFVKAQGFNLSKGLVRELQNDSRAGVRAIYDRLRRHREGIAQENARLKKMSFYEEQAYQQGYRLIAGVDEAGRGPLAGPVVAAAVILTRGSLLPGVDDSKKLTAAKRENLYEIITEEALCWSVGIASVQEIDSLNILRASILAMDRAVSKLTMPPEYILVDAVNIKSLTIPQNPIIKGDGKSVSIAAASIVAKVTRDRLMTEVDEQFPQYGFKQHKGYGTSQHLEAIRKHGICGLHRRTFVNNLAPPEQFGWSW